MKTKDGVGREIVLTKLKKPISHDDPDLQYEPKMAQTPSKIELETVENHTSIAYLKEPLPIEDWKDSKLKNEVTLNVQTVTRSFVKRTRMVASSTKLQKWKENALKIFENSFIYPFVHSDNKYKCFTCPQLFHDANLLKEHALTAHTNEELKQEMNNRRRDTNIKVDISNLQCKICQNTISDFCTLKTHLNDHGLNIDISIQDNLIPFKLGQGVFDCQVCGEKFLKLRLLIIHMSKHFNNYSCEQCGTVFISLILLKRHLKTHETGSFACDVCDKVFNNTAKRRLHMRGVHLKQFPRICPLCPERFNSNYQRTKHLRIVHNQTTGLFKCETCGREYDLKYHLLGHIRSVHLQERNHECPICPSRFFSKYCLSRHMVIHTGEKNFKCNVCGKAYARRKNLNEHLKCHVQHDCSVCGEKFSDEKSLNAHVSQTHGAKS